jgi:hypothetical protein
MKYGEKQIFFNARSLALAGSGIAGGSPVHSTTLNPALIAKSTHQIEGSFSGYFYKNDEDRSYPYYDSFDDFQDFGSYVYNSNWYNDFAFNIIGYIPIPELYKIYIGLSINSLFDFNYKYLEEVRSTAYSDPLLAYNKLEAEGRIKEYACNLAAQIISRLSVGLHIGIIDGNISQKSEITNVDSSLSNIRQIEDNEMTLDGTPVNLQFGAVFDINPHLSIGTVIKLPMTLKYKNQFQILANDTIGITRIIDTDTLFSSNLNSFVGGKYKYISSTVSNQTLKYPMSLGVGLDYRFTNVLEARVSADFEYTFWSDFEDDLNPKLNFEDTYAFKIGVEHIFFDKMPFRVGFNYHSLKEKREYTRAVITAGIGMIFNKFQIDLSGGIANLTYNQLDIFDDEKYGFPNPARDENLQSLPIDRVETSDFYGMIDIKYYLNF